MSILERIEYKSKNLHSKRSTILSHITQVESKLNEYLSGLPIYARSKEITFEHTSEDGGIYGYIIFSEGKINIKYRSTDDDFEDYYNKVPGEFRTYHVIHYSKADIKWIDKIAEKKLIDSLLKDIEKKIDELETDAESSRLSLDRIINSQSNDIQCHTSEILQKLSNEYTYSAWETARRKITEDPSESITRSSSYLESICRQILLENGKNLPTTLDMSNLITQVMNIIGYGIEKQSDEDFKKLFGSIKGIFVSVGSIRTHFGSAHGSNPGDVILFERQARLINSLAGAVSVYMLEQLSQKGKNDTTI